MTPFGEVWGMVGYAIGYGIIFILGERVRRLWPGHPEIARKTVHLLCGLAAAAFPYVFHAFWPVFLLAVGFLGILLVSKTRGKLMSIHGVDRNSLGGIFFPLAICLLFLFGRENPAFFVMAILVLAVSDTLAALVGQRYGRIIFQVGQDCKSLEGSIFFFIATYLCVQIPLLLMTDVGRLETILLAALIALLVTAFESIAVSGSDNLVIPFGTYFILLRLSVYPAGIILQQFLILGLVTALALAMNRSFRFLDTSAVIGVILLNYASWSLCNVHWFIPLLIAQLLYAWELIWYRGRYAGRKSQVHNTVKSLVLTSLLPVGLIFLANIIRDPARVYVSYLVALTTPSAIMASFLFCAGIRRRHEVPLLLKAHGWGAAFWANIVPGTLVGIVPMMFYFGGFAWWMVLVVVMTGLAYLLHQVLQRYFLKGDCMDIEYRLRLISGLAAVGAFTIVERWMGIS
jgi:dolichol kinase